MKLPGAVMSGFIRPSSVGPRLENAARPSELSADLSLMIGATGHRFPVNPPPHVEVIVGRSFSPAATVTTFFADA